MEFENTPSCEEFEKELNRYGIEEKDEIIRIMKIMYMNGGRIPVSQGVTDNKILFSIPEIMKNPNLKILVQRTIGEGTGYNRVYYKELTERGSDIAYNCYIKEVLDREEELLNILKKYNNKLLYLISLGSARGKVIELALKNGEERLNLRDLIYEYRIEESNVIMMAFQEAIKRDYPKARISPGSWNYLDELRKKNLEIIPKKAYEIAFSRFLLNYEKIRREALNVFDELYHHGFATKLPPREYYSAPFELSFFLNKFAERPEKEFTLLKYFFILSLGIKETERDNFYLYLKKFEITEEELAWGINFMHNNKLTTKYNREAEGMPFLILNEEKANEFFNYQLEEIANQILIGGGSKYDTEGFGP